MKFLFPTIFAIIASTLPAPSWSGKVLCDENCPQNEVYSQCAGPQQPNCWNRNLKIDESQCMPGCVCTRGMIRDPNTFACISDQKCPNPPKNPKSCPLNEIYSDCLAGCQRTCDTLNVAFKCRCVPGCICRDGYVRSQFTGKCIPIKDCEVCPRGYKKDVSTGECEFCCQECPENEEFNECGTYCESDCFPRRTFCILLCKRGCFCKSGYVRGPNNGTCIPKEHCPNCPLNESFSCGNPMCEKTCDNYKQNCTIQPIRCEDKCYCKDGLVRNKAGTCVPVSDCNTK